jgi:hypothetical protein
VKQNPTLIEAKARRLHPRTLHADVEVTSNPRKDFPSRRKSRSPSIIFQQLALAVMVVMSAAEAKAGIPEPDLVWYGKVLASSDGANVRLTTGTLVWRIEPLAGGPAFLVATELTNINSQFSFALRIPCETPEPGLAASTNVINLTTPAGRYRRLTVTLNGQPLALISATNEISPLLSDRGRSERIDLRLGTPPVDSDGDGLADSWESLHFGNLNSNGFGDPDGDGVSNLREFRAGTNPNDPFSRFEVVEISQVPNGVAIRWTSQPERRYRVRRSADLLTAPANYVVVQGGLSATPPMNQFNDTTAGGGAQFFYLIEIEE